MDAYTIQLTKMELFAVGSACTDAIVAAQNAKQDDPIADELVAAVKSAQIKISAALDAIQG